MGGKIDALERWHTLAGYVQSAKDQYFRVLTSGTGARRVSAKESWDRLRAEATEFVRAEA